MSKISDEDLKILLKAIDIIDDVLGLSYEADLIQDFIEEEYSEQISRIRHTF